MHTDVDPRIARLLADLSRPDAFPALAEVCVVQTHASLVFLVGDQVYKVKKPLDLGFLDYSTLDRRHRFCTLEVTLNRRLAPDVYVGVEPVTEGPDGRLRIGGDGEVVEWAVHMRRLPEEATLRHAWLHDALPPDALVPVATRLADFHARAERTDAARHAGSLDVVAGLARDNVTALRGDADAVGAALVDKLHTLTEAALTTWGPRIAARAQAGVPCAFHGDLRLEHVYRFPDQPAPGDIVIIDGVEFNDTLRAGDPVADIAFLVMDLQAYGAWPHADALRDAWLTAADDPDAVDLFPLYVSYRSAVRAKVAALLLHEPEVPASDRDAALGRARRHTRLAVGALLPPNDRPRLLLTSGLPGSGKSTLAAALANTMPLTVVRTDVVRKALAGLGPLDRAHATAYGGIYTSQMTERTHQACVDQATAAIEAGGAALVDGNFRDARSRDRFRDLAHTLGVPFGILRCDAPDTVLRRRLRDRKGDASDADERVLDMVLPSWEPPTGPEVVVVDTTAEDVVGMARAGMGL